MVQEYFSGGRLGRLCLKELRESLRDRRTTITLILMPILVYPLLSMALQRLMLGAVRPSDGDLEYVIGVADEEAAQILTSALAATQRANQEGVRTAIEIRRPREREGDVDASGDSEDVAMPTDLSRAPAEVLATADAVLFSIKIPERGSLKEALEDGDLDLAVLSARSSNQTLRRGISLPAFEFQVEFRDREARSEAAMAEFRKAMQMVNDYQSAVLRGRDLPPAIQMVSTAVGRPFDASASLAGILPLVLILMTITGAVYPAIDLTAGERERGTMEAMIATPAPRFILLLSKYSAVVTVAVLTALANLLASWITLSLGGLGRALLGERGFSFWTLLQILPLLVIFAAFFSAILLAMCSYARSFKEAQAYLIPVMLVSLAPALVTLMPNIEFTPVLSILPLINILLLSREIMTGTPDALPATVAILSTLLYAAAALVVAAKLFGAESATSGSQESWSDWIRRPKRLRSHPGLGEVAIFLAMLFPVFFVASNLAWQIELSTPNRMLANAVLLAGLFLFAPALFAWYRRIQWRETFLLRWGPEGGESSFARTLTQRSLYFLSAVLLALGLWIVAYEVLKILDDWGLATLSNQRSEDLERIKADLLSIPFWQVLLFSAVLPAIAEEFFFRGFVLSAFRARTSPLRAVVYSALLFGLFHVFGGVTLTLERFVPTALLGLALGILAVRSDSLWPGIILHAVHNGLLFWLTRFTPQDLAAWFGAGNEHFPWPWILASSLTIFGGMVLLYLYPTKRSYEVAP